LLRGTRVPAVAEETRVRENDKFKGPLGPRRVRFPYLEKKTKDARITPGVAPVAIAEETF